MTAHDLRCKQFTDQQIHLWGKGAHSSCGESAIGTVTLISRLREMDNSGRPLHERSGGLFPLKQEEQE